VVRSVDEGQGSGVAPAQQHRCGGKRQGGPEDEDAETGPRRQRVRDRAARHERFGGVAGKELGDVGPHAGRQEPDEDGEEQQQGDERRDRAGGAADDPSERPAERADAIRYTPTPATARSVPGFDSEEPWSSADRKICPPKNAAKEASVIDTSATVLNTTVLAARTCSRRGTAANVERIMPVPYSPVTNRTPRTPTISWVSR
jgi:hypothetical protein